jgi:hypothetical protein
VTIRRVDSNRAVFRVGKEVRKEHRLSPKEPPLWRYLGRKPRRRPIEPIRAERASIPRGLGKPSEIEIRRRQQFRLGKEPGRVPGERIPPHFERERHRAVTAPGVEDLCLDAGKLELHASSLLDTSQR